MRYRIAFSPEADAQIVGIYRYIAEQASSDIAENFARAIVDCCEALETFPERGARRDDVRPGLRVIGFRRRVSIAFTVGADVVTIVGVFYGGQNFEALLKPQE